MSKKETKRYTISVLEKIETQKIGEEETLTSIQNKIEKYNSNSKKRYIIGDIILDSEKQTITYKKYKKLSIRTTLPLIDKMTTRLQSEKQLKYIYSVNTQNPNPVVITYRASKQVRELTIIYEPDKKYLDPNYVLSKYIEYINNLDFINKILNNKQIETNTGLYLDRFERLNRIREALIQGITEVNKTFMYSFYFTFVKKGNNFNYYNFRLLACLLMEFEQEHNLVQTPVEETYEQLIMENYLVGTSTSTWEDIKITASQDGIEEARKKLLTLSQKTTN